MKKQHRLSCDFTKKIKKHKNHPMQGVFLYDRISVCQVHQIGKNFSVKYIAQIAGEM